MKDNDKLTENHAKLLALLQEAVVNFTQALQENSVDIAAGLTKGQQFEADLQEMLAKAPFSDSQRDPDEIIGLHEIAGPDEETLEASRQVTKKHYMYLSDVPRSPRKMLLRRLQSDRDYGEWSYIGHTLWVRDADRLVVSIGMPIYNSRAREYTDKVVAHHRQELLAAAAMYPVNQAKAAARPNKENEESGHYETLLDMPAELAEELLKDMASLRQAWTCTNKERGEWTHISGLVLTIPMPVIPKNDVRGRYTYFLEKLIPPTEAD